MAIPIVIKAIRKGGGSGVCEYNTQAYWNAQTTYIPAAGTIIIYSDIDKMRIADGVLTVPRLPWWEEEYTNSEIENLWKNT